MQPTAFKLSMTIGNNNNTSSSHNDLTNKTTLLQAIPQHFKVKNLKMNVANYCLEHNSLFDNFENTLWGVAVKKISLTNFIVEQDS